MLNNLKLNHIDLAQAQTIKDNETGLIEAVEIMSSGFRIGNDQDSYIIKKKLKKNDKKKNKSIVIGENTTELLLEFPLNNIFDTEPLRVFL